MYLTSSPPEGRGFQLLRRLEQQLRFAVHGPGYPVASPRSHGVPRRDVPGRVHVSVAGETAGRAPEDGLALARLPIHVPARRAALAGERGVDLLHPAGRLVLQPAHQQSPPRPHDLAVEPGFLAHVPARVLPRAFRGSGHVPDLEVFDPDQVKSARDVSAGLLRPVLAPIRLAGAQPGYGQLDPGPPVRSWPGAGEPALKAPQPLSAAQAQPRRGQHLTRRQRRADGYPADDPDGLSVARAGDRIRDHGKGDVPAPGAVKRDAVRLRARRHRAGPAEPYPSGLRHAHLAGVAGQAAHLAGLDGDDPEPPVPAGLPPRRPPGPVLRVEEGGRGLGEVAQRLLLHHLGACGQPRVLRAGGGELPALFQVARRARAAWAPVRVLLDGEVPCEPGVAAVVPQRCLLGGRGEQTVPGHANTLANTTGISGEVKRRFLPGPKAGVSTPRSR